MSHKLGFSWVLLFASNALFVLLALVLYYHNRLAVDDFYFLANLNKHGVLHATALEYSSWSTRYTSVFVNNLVLLLHQKTNIGLFVFGTFILLIYTLTVYYLVQNILRIINATKPKKVEYSRIQLLSISVFIVSVLFISTIKIDETWFWLCSSCTYLLSNIFLLLGIACLIDRSNKLLISFSAALSFLYIGGSSGPLALVALVLLLLLLMRVSLVSSRLMVEKKVLFQRVLLCLSVGLAAFFILYIGKGNRVRESFFKDIDLFQSVVLNFKMTGIIFLKRLPAVFPLMVFLCLPIIFFGNRFYTVSKPKHFFKKSTLLTACFVVVVYLYQLPITYKTQDVAAYRALYFITVLSVIYVSVIYFILGKYISISLNLLKATSYFSLLFSLFFFAKILMEQYEITGKYCDAYDNRIAFIEQHKNSPETIGLTPLPPSGLLYSAEVTKDTSYFSNRHLQNAFGLKYGIRLQ